MQEMTIHIANEYTKTPGGRYRKEGHGSGEEFRETLLKPAYIGAKKAGCRLTVILDGGYGNPPGFLEEAFGGLARDLKDRGILNIRVISDEEPGLIADIRKYISDALDIA